MNKRQKDLTNAAMIAEKLLLADQIRKALVSRQLTGKAAQEITGLSEADISRLRNQTQLELFKLDRLIFVAIRLGYDVTINVRVKK